MSQRETPSGPHTVAICDARLADDTSPSLRLRLFYPTSPAPNGSPAVFLPPSPTSFPDRTVVNILRFASIPLASLLAIPLSYAAKLPLPALKTGEVLPSAGAPYPLMLFSHGLGGSVGNYSNFCIDHASHGYIVIAPEHTDGSAFEALVGSEEKSIPYESYESNRHGPSTPFRARQLDTRCNDLLAVLSALYQLSRPNSTHSPLVPLRSECPVPKLTNIIDFDNIVLAGHSFGAATSLILSTRSFRHGIIEPRAAICLDAWLSPISDRIHTLEIPPSMDLLFIDMAEANMIDSIKARSRLKRSKFSDAATDGMTDAVKVIGALHNDASDFPLRMPHWLAVKMRLTLKDSDPLQLLQSQNKVSQIFLNGKQSWAFFRGQIENKREELIQLAELENSIG